MPAGDELRWRVLDEEPAGDYGVFRVKRQRAEHLVSRRIQSFSVIDCPDWVNVLAITRDQQAVFVRQYRPGVKRVTLELPGGVMEPGESPQVAAERELAEETGYRAKTWHNLGFVEPNPALQGNRCWTLLGLDAAEHQSPQPDEDEVVEVITHPVAQVPELVLRREVTHSLVVAAFYLHSRWATRAR
jgi:ADP-ribose pyrophosphatase